MPAATFANDTARELRRRLGSRPRIAPRIGIHPDTLKAIERGRSLPSMPTLLRLAEVLGCAPGDLFHVTSESREPAAS
jgi:DNA-binding XRE family transcriptional regulator